MAHETSEPRTTLIVFFTALSVVTLMVLHPMFNSYFDSMMGNEARVQQVENERYYQAYKDFEGTQRSALAEGPMPIERAMEAVANRRHELPQVAPEPSTDVQALSGWTSHPDYVEPPPAPAPPPTQPVEAGAQEDETIGERP